jgi:hypothetical protein
MYKEILNLYDNLKGTITTYDDNQPTKNAMTKFLKYIFFDDSVINILPRIKNGLSNSSIQILFFNNILGNYLQIPNIPFNNETDFLKKTQNLFVKAQKSNQSQQDFFDNFLDKFIGYDMITYKKNKCVIDMRYLSQFEVKKGYSTLNCIVYLDDKHKFDYCKINGQKRTDDFAIRECLTAIITIITYEHHLLNVHLIITDNLNILLDTLDKKNFIYRLLIPTKNDVYSVNEMSLITLFGKTGMCDWLNFTRNGIIQYCEYVKQNFNFRRFLTPCKIQGESSLQKHKQMWFNCIHGFVGKFLDVQPNIDCDRFINLLGENYKGIIDETKSDKENINDICTMIIYSNIIHEVYSNPALVNVMYNPFIISTTWKENDSSKLTDKINNLDEYIKSSFIYYVTDREAIRQDSSIWIDKCCINENEKKIYNEYLTAISRLNIPVDAILYPGNISSSISY